MSGGNSSCVWNITYWRTQDITHCLWQYLCILNTYDLTSWFRITSCLIYFVKSTVNVNRIYIYIQWNLGSQTPLITNKLVHEQIFQRKKKTSRVTNGVSSNGHASRQQRLATSWEYRQESVSCCVTFAQYTSLLEFAVPSLEFHCVLCFFYILLNKTPWDQRSLGLWSFWVTNGLQEQIKFANRGSTV
jgi:hypothetical protein